VGGVGVAWPPVGVGSGVGRDVLTGVGAGSPVEVGWVARGRGLDTTGMAGAALAMLWEGAIGAADGTGLGDGLGSVGLDVGVGSVLGVPVDGGFCGVGDDVLRVGLGLDVGTTAMPVGPGDAAPRCCNCTPPIPRATVARTRFRRPRLRMRRAR
jgi:hypothetical protein